MNILDYLTWRGDLPLTAIPWCHVDAAALCLLGYLNIGEPASRTRFVSVGGLEPDKIENATNTKDSFAKRIELVRRMCVSPRYRDIILHHYVNLLDPEREMQFSAICADLPENVTCVIFRGTDNTLVGWREDFNMSFECPVPSQEAACAYLEQIAAMRGRRLWVMGHSKGGNMALYAAAHVSDNARSMCERIYSFDGPGVDMATFRSGPMEELKPRIFSFVPQTSIIGMTLGYHQQYTVVHADAVGLAQHDLFTWQIEGPRFVTEEKVDKTSEFMSETLQEWLIACTPQQRSVFVDVIFRMMEDTEATTLSQVGENKLKLTKMILNATVDMDPEKRRTFLKLLGQFVSTGAGNIIEMLTQKDKPEPLPEPAGVSPEKG